MTDGAHSVPAWVLQRINGGMLRWRLQRINRRTLQIHLFEEVSMIFLQCTTRSARTSAMATRLHANSSSV